MIYLDTSAAMKLVRPETYSSELSRWFTQRRGMSVFSSMLIEVELLRATRRSIPERLARASDVLRGIGVVTLSPSVVVRAAGYDDPPSDSPSLLPGCTEQSQGRTALTGRDT
ncbi:MAG: hypothetical protein ACR2FG_06840 [Marmoricola sp.]